MSAHDPRSPEPLPELDLDEDEMMGVRPSLPQSAGGAAIPFTAAKPPPPGAPLIPVSPRDLLPAQPKIEIDLPDEVVVEAKYRPPVFGVPCGADEPEPEAEEALKREAARVAGYGSPPKEFWKYGLYAYRVALRYRAIRSETLAMKRSADLSYSAYEKAVVAFGERAKASSKTASDGLSVGQVRSSAASSGQKLESGSTAASNAERGIIELAFRALGDRKVFGREFDQARREIDGLLELAQKRARTVKLNELALNTFNRNAAIFGAVSYIGGSILLLLFIFSPVIYRMIHPPELPPLPPEPPPPPTPKP